MRDEQFTPQLGLDLIIRDYPQNQQISSFWVEKNHCKCVFPAHPPQIEEK